MGFGIVVVNEAIEYGVFDGVFDVADLATG